MPKSRRLAPVQTEPSWGGSALKAGGAEGQLVDLAIPMPYNCKAEMVDQKPIFRFPADPRIMMNASQTRRITFPDQKSSIALDEIGLHEALQDVCTSKWDYKVRLG